MSSDLSHNNQIDYRSLYGKLFSGLLSLFGTNYVSEIEDAIQNSFLKSLKISNQKSRLDNLQNWLFIVARNDVLSQIKNKQKQHNLELYRFPEDREPAEFEKDLRLQTILFIASVDNISTQSKIIFILKTIFGLSIAEIHSCTLLSEEAIYKSAARTKKSIQQRYESTTADIHSVSGKNQTIYIVEEILYSVFNIGFDSFSEKTEDIINLDLCLEAFSLTKLLLAAFHLNSTSNLLAVFSLHTARIPAKIDNGRLISFFKQNREKWDQQLFQLGLYYLKKPEAKNKFYIEALIVVKYMTIQNFAQNDWDDIIKLYRILLGISHSPILKLNYCYGLSKAGKTEAALKILLEIEKELPEEHTYFKITKAKILAEINPEESNALFTSVKNKLSQKIRKKYLSENQLKDSGLPI